MRLIAITGGIGSGKSVVSQLLQVMGYQVYDCDSRAKALMIESEDVRRQLIQAFGEQTYVADGSLNRIHLSEVAFADPLALKRLNSIVHPATALDMRKWGEKLSDQGHRIAFVETALLRTAGLDRVVDGVWHVTAPEQLRIQRVSQRSGLTAQQIKERMAAQADEERIVAGEDVITNDGMIALLPQVMQLLQDLE